MPNVTARVERWPIRGAFRIARGEKREAVVVVAELSEGAWIGRGECVPYARYGESVESVVRSIEAVDGRALERGSLGEQLPRGAARNALDCALLDLEARRSGTTVHAILGVPWPVRTPTCVTLSVAAPEAAHAWALAHERAPLLKVKLAGDALDLARLRAVRDAAPSARIVADANESWTPSRLERDLAELAVLRVALLEQPLPAGDDESLRDIEHLVPIAADESVHDRATLARAAELYDVVNVKLDKAGGLTEALAVVLEAKRLGVGVELGCMVATSLSMAPALLLASFADIVDLDGAWLLERDRDGGVRYDGGFVEPAAAGLWGAR